MEKHISLFEDNLLEFTYSKSAEWKTEFYTNLPIVFEIITVDYYGIVNFTSNERKSHFIFQMLSLKQTVSNKKINSMTTSRHGITSSHPFGNNTINSPTPDNNLFRMQLANYTFKTTSTTNSYYGLNECLQNCLQSFKCTGSCFDLQTSICATYNVNDSIRENVLIPELRDHQTTLCFSKENYLNTNYCMTDFYSENHR